MNKEMARRLMAARRRASKARRPVPAPHPNDVRRPLDTWSPRQVEKFKQDFGAEEQKGAVRPWGLGNSVPEIPAETPSSSPEKPAKALSKSRRTKLTISMSEEEAHIVRTWLDKTGRSLGEWGREVLFAAMGRKIPPRH